MANIKVIYEDEWLMVIDKPAGVVVNRAETVAAETIQDLIEKTRSENTGLERSGMVHRLDKDTSGVMIVAKTAAVGEILKLRFKTRQVKKEYVALVYGKLEPSRGDVAVPLGRSKLNREKFAVRPGGKWAETKYEVANYWQDSTGKMYTEVRLYPKTGRTHQLRVHLAYLGHPIVGDERYGGEKRVRQGGLKIKRQWLHAQRLSLAHPMTGKMMTWEADLAGDLKSVLRQLK